MLEILIGLLIGLNLYEYYKRQKFEAFVKRGLNSCQIRIADNYGMLMKNQLELDSIIC